MEILENCKERLAAALAQQQLDYRLISFPSVLGGIERTKWMITVERIENIQDRWNRVLPCSIEREDFVRCFLSDCLRGVAGVDPEILFEQFYDRQVRNGAAVRGWSGLQDQPVRRGR